MSVLLAKDGEFAYWALNPGFAASGCTRILVITGISSHTFRATTGGGGHADLVAYNQ